MKLSCGRHDSSRDLFIPDRWRLRFYHWKGHFPFLPQFHGSGKWDVSNISFLPFGVIFYFHDYGRKGSHPKKVTIAELPAQLLGAWFNPHLKNMPHVKLDSLKCQGGKKSKSLKPTWTEKKIHFDSPFLHPRCRRGHCRKANPLQTSINYGNK